MIATDEDALICDFAETYRIYDFRGLPVRTSAALAFGLPDNSRIKMQLAGLRVPQETLLLALIADRLAILAWQQTEDARKGKNPPKSIYEILTARQDDDDETFTFDSPEAFEAARAKLFGGN